MSLSQVTVACPHCRREYEISIDLAKLSRVTSRASCARCKKVFEVTPERVQPRNVAPKPPREPYVARTDSGDRYSVKRSERRPDDRDIRRVSTEDRDIRRPHHRDDAALRPTEQLPRSATDDTRRAHVRRPSDHSEIIRRGTDDDRRDVRRPSDHSEIIRRAATEPLPEDNDAPPSRTDSRDLQRTESRADSRDLPRAESRTESRDGLRRADARTDSREGLRRADARTDSREGLRRADARTESRDMRRPDDVLRVDDGRDAEPAVARTRSARSAPRSNVEAFAEVSPPSVPAPQQDLADDPDTAWIVRADPGLGNLTMAQSEGAAALEWLLAQATRARV